MLSILAAPVTSTSADFGRWTLCSSFRASLPDCIYWPSGSLIDPTLFSDWPAMILTSLALSGTSLIPWQWYLQEDNLAFLTCYSCISQLLVLLAWLTSCHVEAFRHLNSMFHQGAVLGKRPTLGGHFWWNGERMACCTMSLASSTSPTECITLGKAPRFAFRSS